MRVDGLEKYMLLINIMRMLAHVRFVYVRMTLLSVSKDEEASTVKVRWNIVGLGMARLVLRYFPDRLWEKGNMERSDRDFLVVVQSLIKHSNIPGRLLHILTDTPHFT